MSIETEISYRETISAAKDRLKAIYRRLEQIKSLNFVGIPSEVFDKYQQEVNELGKEVSELSSLAKTLQARINAFYKPASAA